MGRSNKGKGSADKQAAIARKLRAAKQRQAPPENMAEQMKRMARQRLPANGVARPTIRQIDDVTLEIMQEICRQVSSELAQEEIDESERERPTACPSCEAARIESRGREARSLTGRFGTRTYQRRRYRCEQCQTNFVPADEQVEMPESRFTAEVDAAVAQVGAWMPFADAAKLVLTLMQVRVSASYVRTETEAQGAQAIAQPPTMEKRATPPTRLYVMMDGCYVPVFGAAIERHGRGKRKRCVPRVYHEVKVGVVIAEWHDEAGQLPRSIKRWCVSVGNANEFRAQLWLAGRMGMHDAGEVIVIGDGAEWIEHFATRYLSGIAERVRFVIDFWHLAEKLHEAAATALGDAAKARRWADRTIEHARNSRLDLVLRRLKELPAVAASKASRDAVTTPADAIRYIENREAYMPYAQLKAAGISIGSGPVESACKTVVKHGACQSGMIWKVGDLGKVLALRAALLNDADYLNKAA